MSYTLDLILETLPEADKPAWQRIEALREGYYDDPRAKAPALVDLHAALAARYPCLSSYADDDPRLDGSPWADGPMLGNFAHEMGMLAIVFSRVDEVVPFVIAEATARGITVADGQSGQIHRPGASADKPPGKRPWWRFWK